MILEVNYHIHHKVLAVSWVLMQLYSKSNTSCLAPLHAKSAQKREESPALERLMYPDAMEQVFHSLSAV